VQPNILPSLDTWSIALVAAGILLFMFTISAQLEAWGLAMLVVRRRVQNHR
jgi:hypothetical protein